MNAAESQGRNFSRRLVDQEARLVANAKVEDVRTRVVTHHVHLHFSSAIDIRTSNPQESQNTVRKAQILLLDDIQVDVGIANGLLREVGEY